MLGVDDGPFEKGQKSAVPIVGVMMEGADLVEATAITEFPVDGEDATGFLSGWIAGLRMRPTTQAVVLGGITIAGLGIIDIRALASSLELPILVVTRRDPRGHRVNEALEAAGLAERIPIVDTTPEAFALHRGLYVACAGVERGAAEQLVHASSGKSSFPEPLRVAHLIAAARVSGESRGRV